MKSRVIEIEYRGMKAWAFGSMMRIQTLSGMTVGGTNDWHGAGLKGQEAKTEQLRKDLDKFIALEWFFLRHGGREDGLYRTRETR